MDEATDTFNSQSLLSKLRLGIKVSNFGLGEVDYVEDTITFDTRAAEIFDLPANTPVTRDVLHQKIHPDDWPLIEDKVHHLLTSSGDDFIDIEHRVVKSDGSIV